jgi:hypothetical protein
MALVSHIGRDKNQFVDVLANLAFMDKVDYGNIVQPISIEVKKFSSSLLHSQKEKWKGIRGIMISNILCIIGSIPWRYPIHI